MSSVQKVDYHQCQLLAFLQGQHQEPVKLINIRLNTKMKHNFILPFYCGLRLELSVHVIKICYGISNKP